MTCASLFSSSVLDSLAFCMEGLVIPLDLSSQFRITFHPMVLSPACPLCLLGNICSDSKIRIWSSLEPLLYILQSNSTITHQIAAFIKLLSQSLTLTLFWRQICPHHPPRWLVFYYDAFNRTCSMRLELAVPYLTLGSVGKGAGKQISQLWALPLQVCKFLIGFLIVSVTHPPIAF